MPYAVIGGNAVAAWVATVDPAAVRNTQDVNVLLRRGDLDAAQGAMAAAGFVYCQVGGIDMFLNGPTAGQREAVHVIIAGEKVRPADLAAAADVTEASRPDTFQVIALEALVRMELTSDRIKNKMHVHDMIDVGLVDATWVTRLPPELAARLQVLIDTPEG